MAPTATNRAV